MISLNRENFFAAGSQRDCYLHPFDNSKIIKIIKCNNSQYNQNDLEEIYYHYLISKKVSFTHITKFFGKIETNLGFGLIFEKIMDYDNNISKQLTYYLKNNLLTDSEEKKLLLELKIYLENNNIVFIDAATMNVLCQKISSKEYKLIIIDGLGGKRVGLKSYLYMKTPLYSKYKIKKQWKKFMYMVNRLK